MKAEDRARYISTHAPREGSDRTVPISTSARPPFQPTLPARGATLHHTGLLLRERISTHAPREGSDRRQPGHHRQADYFNPRSPRGERRDPDCTDPAEVVFQPTLPARGATTKEKVYMRGHPISTHAPREGSDPAENKREAGPKEFQPTLPARGATCYYVEQPTKLCDISTHAPREGSDGPSRTAIKRPSYFNPRSPRGERRRI